MEAPTFKLSKLRDIGWAHWDPIDLGGHPADEYDEYLLQAASKIWNGQESKVVQSYLVNIEREHMGLGEVSDMDSRACATVEALQEYVAEMRG